jgi:hypothetical protein
VGAGTCRGVPSAPHVEGASGAPMWVPKSEAMWELGASLVVQYASRPGDAQGWGKEKLSGGPNKAPIGLGTVKPNEACRGAGAGKVPVPLGVPTEGEGSDKGSSSVRKLSSV